MYINCVVEGASDLGVAEVLVAESGHTLRRSFDKGGKSRLDPDIPKYVQAALHGPEVAWLILRDSDSECPVHLRQTLTKSGDYPVPDNFLLRIVHTMSEGWFLGDRRGVSGYFRVPLRTLPYKPEEMKDPKRFLLQLSAKHSPVGFRNRFVRMDGSPGPEFTAIMNDFALNHWDLPRAAEESPSLQRALDRHSQLH